MTGSPVALPVFVHAALFQVVDQLDLVRLIGELLARFVRAHFAVDERVILADDLAHPRFDLVQVFRQQCARQVKVIVKAVLDGRADGDLAFGEHFQHRLRHHVRSRVPDTMQFVVVFF